MTFDMIKRNFDRRLWNKQMVKVAVVKGVITPTQYFNITTDKEFLKTLVIDNTITKVQYKEITGEDYTTE